VKIDVDFKALGLSQEELDEINLTYSSLKILGRLAVFLAGIIEGDGDRGEWSLKFKTAPGNPALVEWDLVESTGSGYTARHRERGKLADLVARIETEDARGNPYGNAVARE
jgi:hypothetical protein